MPRIFLSYRRSDSDYALLLYEFLKQHFGRERVFLDVDDIEPGDNFVDTLERELASSGAFVALIGRGWLESLARLQEERDYVALEVATALARGGLVIPVLAGGARMPAPAQLPAALTTLPQRSAVEVRVHGDLDALVRVIGKVIPVRAAGDDTPTTPQQRRMLALLRRQVHRINVRAVELLGANQTDRAFDELHEGMELLMCLQEWSPAEVSSTLHLGYLYKTTAQAFLSTGDREQASHYFDLAASVFEQARSASARTRYSSADLAGALNGLANIQYYRGDYERAVESGRLAVTLEPDYALAWHDLFGSYVEQAKHGKVNVAAMRDAYENMTRAGQGTPGLSEQYVNQLAGYLRQWEQQANGETTQQKSATSRTIRKRR